MNTDKIEIKAQGYNVGLAESEEIRLERPLVDLSIIVVSYNTSRLLRSCLQSVYANAHSHYTSEIIVVDNASPDDSAEMVRREFPQAHLIANTENRGFAAANNQALKLAKGHCIVLLNPDTEVVGAALWQMVAFLEAEPGAAAVGPALLYADGSFQEGAFRFPGLFQIFFDFFPLNWRFTRSRLNGRYPRRLYEEAYPRAFEIDFSLGACLMVRRAVLEQIGLLDEAFFMYMEEIDWCYRIKAARPNSQASPWRIYCLPASKVIHHAGASSRQFRDEMFYQLHRSRAYFYKKHYSRLFQFAARFLTRFGVAALTLDAMLKHRQNKITPAEFEARRRAYGRIWSLK